MKVLTSGKIIQLFTARGKVAGTPCPGCETDVFAADSEGGIYACAWHNANIQPIYGKKV